MLGEGIGLMVIGGIALGVGGFALVTVGGIAMGLGGCGVVLRSLIDR
jgi:hypothetical protein